jgi:putative endonuclease
MYYTYILFSSDLNRYYIGYSSNVEERLAKHNNHHKGFTNAGNDWEIVFTRAFETKQEALSFERKIKSWKSRKMIEQLISTT